MKKILLDSNFLISLVKFKVDLEEIGKLQHPYELITTNLVWNELKNLSKGNKNARIAMKMIEVKNIRIIKSKEKNADEAMIQLADKDTIVATNDIELRKRLKAMKIKTIYLRAKKKLAIS